MISMHHHMTCTSVNVTAALASSGSMRVLQYCSIRTKHSEVAALYSCASGNCQSGLQHEAGDPLCTNLRKRPEKLTECLLEARVI